jgi:2-dehydro-3-deoxyphosphogluconate aldolase / (4S)-4-hydroxy-2-oxoglutarate aldolase
MDHSTQPSLPSVVPLVVVDDPSWITPLVQAFADAEVTTVEIGLRTPHALAAIEAFAATGRFQVAAGTVTTSHQVDEVRDAGATFGLSPWGDPEVVSYAQSLSWPFIPGAATPTEVHQLVSVGCETVKIFPVKQLGGVSFLRSLAAVFPTVTFLPTGGITADTAAEYLAVDQVVSVSGSWLAPGTDMRDGRWEDISRRLRESTALK